MTPLRWGVLGAANIAVRVVIPALQRSRNGRVVAIASRTAERARDAGQSLDIPRAHASYEALLADPEVDALYIPLPNSIHREWTTRAADAGKHVLCEKPLALTAADCVAMIAACRDRGVVLMEAFMYRFHPRTIRVAQLARDGALGEVRLVRASFSFRVLAPENIRLQPALGGGALYDVGCYGVNVSRLILGEPRNVVALATTAPSGVEDLLAATLQFAGERVAVVDCGLSLSRREEYEVVGTEGRLTVPVAFLPGTADAEIHITKGTNRSTETIPGVNQYQLMVEHFADVVAGRMPLTLPPDDAVANLRVIEAALRSVKSSHVEAVEP